MLLTKKVIVVINTSNINHYLKLGYENIKRKDIIEIPIDKLSKGSNIKIKAKCDICGNEKEIIYFRYIENISKYNIFSCGRKCSNIKREKTNLEKYNVKNISELTEIKDKRKNTMIERYGVEHALQNVDIKKKSLKTNNKRYNSEFPQKLKFIKDKIEKTNIEKYGFKVAIMNHDIKEKQKKSLKNFYNNKILKNYKNIISYENGIYKFKCEKGHIFELYSTLLHSRKFLNKILCTKCNPLILNKSSLQFEITNFIKNYTEDIILNDRHLGKELDIYIPELKLAFEINGLYWHNELYKDKKYHLNKTELCEKNGIQLIHIYEDDWIYKQDIIKSMILNKLSKTPNKIYARKCEIREITDNKLVREFLDENHIQGFIGSKVKIGLFHENELVSLMMFGKRRVEMGKKTSEEGEFELLRFCSKLNTNVVGGGNKLFKYFVKNYDPKMITTYADRSWSNGNLYNQLGFKYEGKTEPNYYYIIDGIRHHRFNFRKDKLVKEGYDPSLTEHQIMLNRKIYRIFDSGNLKFNF